MNTKQFASGLLLGAALLSTSSLFAGEKASVKVFEPVKINGTTLAPGRYDVAWEGSGSNVQVSIHKGKETVATAPAQLETAQTAPENTGYGTRTETDGTKSLTNFFFAGKKYSLNLEQQSAATSASAASASASSNK